MKHIIVVFSLICMGGLVKGQTTSGNDPTWSVTLSYTGSFVSYGFFYDKVILPPSLSGDVLYRGCSARVGRDIGEHMFLSGGLTYRTSGPLQASGILFPEPFVADRYIGPYTEKWQDWYFDMPIDIGYKAKLGRKMQLRFDLGLRTNYTFYDYWANHHSSLKSDDELKFRGGFWSMGVDVGMRQSYQISKHFDMVLYESYGYYVVGEHAEKSSFEVSLGLGYRI